MVRYANPTGAQAGSDDDPFPSSASSAAAAPKRELSEWLLETGRATLIGQQSGAEDDPFFQDGQFVSGGRSFWLRLRAGRRPHGAGRIRWPVYPATLPPRIKAEEREQQVSPSRITPSLQKTMTIPAGLVESVSPEPAASHSAREQPPDDDPFAGLVDAMPATPVASPLDEIPDDFWFGNDAATPKVIPDDSDLPAGPGDTPDLSNRP
ncbi:MAG: hypothetical protein R3E95_23515 [Thiolinea sp.]